MKKSLSDNEESDLWALLGQARRAMGKVRSKELHEYNISTSKSTILNIIYHMGNEATPVSISRMIFLEPHSVSELLSRMEKEGLVRRVKDLEKRNQVRIELTDKGREVYSQTVKLESIHRLLSPLSHEERQQLRLCLEKLRDEALKELGIKHKPLSPS